MDRAGTPFRVYDALTREQPAIEAAQLRAELDRRIALLQHACASADEALARRALDHTLVVEALRVRRELRRRLRRLLTMRVELKALLPE